MMNYLIFLAGGIGSRMKSLDCPKQYLLVDEKPIFLYSLEIFEKSGDINGIIIVAHKEWREFISKWIKKADIKKFITFADAGEARQSSIYNGLKLLKKLAKQEDNVIIHDAARPLVSGKLIHNCLRQLDKYDGVMPVLPAKDTFYQSADGKNIGGLLPREHLFAGQAPESFKMVPYILIHEEKTDDEINKMTGSTEIAYKAGLTIKMIPGEEQNFKITTEEDIRLFKMYLQGERVKNKLLV